MLVLQILTDQNWGHGLQIGPGSGLIFTRDGFYEPVKAWVKEVSEGLGQRRARSVQQSVCGAGAVQLLSELNLELECAGVAVAMEVGR